MSRPYLCPQARRLAEDRLAEQLCSKHWRHWGPGEPVELFPCEDHIAEAQALVAVVVARRWSTQ